MEGVLSLSHSNRGVIPRTFARIFDSVDKVQDETKTSGTITTKEVFVSFLQIYNDKIMDLMPGHNAGETSTARRLSAVPGTPGTPGTARVVCSLHQVTAAC